MTTIGSEPELARIQRRRTIAPYLLLLPGIGWLAFFFLVPILRLVTVSLQSGIYPRFTFTWQWDNYTRLWTTYGSQVWNSLRFALLATLICLVLAYPLAYFIAFRGGRWKNFLVVMLLMPFLMPFLLRTLSWKIILADEGLVVSTLKTMGLLGADRTLLATSVAVVAGIAYNFLPFMALPIYVALEKLDRSLNEASADLYATPWETFRRVTFPLSLPGVVAGTLLTFIPAIGDYVNVLLLGSPSEFMIGNVIQSRFLVALDYPVAAALSFTLMVAIVALLVPYVRASGTDELVA